MRDTAISMVTLPAPDRGGPGRAVLAALEKRCTTREISDEPLPRQELGNLLWAAWGVNRKTGPLGGLGRTAGSASNSQEIDLYVALKEGAYLYDATEHRLGPICSEDLRMRALTPSQQRVSSLAAAQFIYVADMHRLTHTRGFDEPGLHDAEVQKSYCYVDTGFIAANVYLFAAAVGLAAWFHNCDRSYLHQKLKLRPEQRVLFAQSVGYPAQYDD